jgi:hypothetical protein
MLCDSAGVDSWVDPMELKPTAATGDNKKIKGEKIKPK